jgi:hypothetical protein
MKKIFLPVSLLAITSLTQAQITINSSDMPIPTAPINLAIIPASSVSTPSVGSNMTWDFGSSVPTSTATNDYIIETDPAFTASGVDIYLDEFKSFNPNFGYNISHEMDFNSNGVDDKALYVYAQSYDLASFTGSNLDSLKMQEQKIILSSPRKIIKFPMTQGSIWQSSSRRAVNFSLSVAAYGLNNTPAQHVFYMNRNDSIIGYGKLRIYTIAGPSAYYDVLMSKTTQITKDSFYLAGAPAPTALLTAFGVTQGQEIESQFNYNFYRKGSYNYMMRIKHSDANYTIKTSAVIHTDFVTPTSIEDNKAELFSTFVFPNPSRTSQINMMISNTQYHHQAYNVIDQNGRIISSGVLELNNLMAKINLGDNITNGVYYIKVAGNNYLPAISETIRIQR